MIFNWFIGLKPYISTYSIIEQNWYTVNTGFPFRLVIHWYHWYSIKRRIQLFLVYWFSFLFSHSFLLFIVLIFIIYFNIVLKVDFIFRKLRFAWYIEKVRLWIQEPNFNGIVDYFFKMIIYIPCTERVVLLFVVWYK